MQVLRKWSPKDPDDTGDFWLNWAYILPDTTNITAATVDVPVGLVKEDEEFTDKKVRVRLSGGTHGSVYDLEYDVDTDTDEHFHVIVSLSVQTRKKK